MDVVQLFNWLFFIVSIILPLLLLGVSIAVLIQDAKDDEIHYLSYFLSIGCLLSGLIPASGINLFEQKTVGLIWLIIFALLFLPLVVLFLLNRNHVLHYIGNSLACIFLFFIYGTYVGFLEYRQDETANILSHWGITYPSSLLTFWAPLSVLVIISTIIGKTKTNNYIHVVNEDNKNRGKEKSKDDDLLNPTLLRIYTEDITRAISEYHHASDIQIKKISESIEEIKNRKKQPDNKKPEGSQLSDVISEIHELKNELESNRAGANDNKRVIRELYHFFETPFTNIDANCKNLRNVLKKSDYKQISISIQSIESSIELCRGYITFYREVESITSQEEAVDNLDEAVKKAFSMFNSSLDKNLKIKTRLSSSYQNYSNFELITILSPLIQNAVAAAPNKSEILVIEQDDCIIVSNEYDGIIDIDNLKKDGYSSKPDHEGLGLKIVRNLIAAKKMQPLKIETNSNNRISFIIKLKK